MEQPSASVFEIVRDGDCLIVSPTADLGEIVFVPPPDGATGILSAFADGAVRHLVWDLCHIRMFGSTAVGFFLKLSQYVTGRRGRVAFCNLTTHERKILHLTRADTLFPLCDDLESALRSVRE
jgi:anti-anti-sigma factor